MPTGLHTSYNNTVPLKRTVTDRIIMADPKSIVPITVLGLNNESKFSFVNAPGRMYEWLEDTYAPTSDTAGSTAALTNDSTLTQFAVTNGAYFQVGDIIEIDAEKMWVSAISTNTLTVTRNYGGTQATHASTATVYIRTRSRIEGADAGNSNYTEVTSGYNYSQILQKTIKVSRTDQLVNRYGIGSVVDREIDKAMDELMMLLSKVPYYGVRNVGTSSAARSTGGWDTFITTNVTTLSSSPALLQKNLEDAVQNIFTYSSPTRLQCFCGAWAKRKVTDFYAGYVRTERSENYGGINIDYIETPLGVTLEMVVDRFCPSTKMYLIDPRYSGYIPIDPFFWESLGKTGDTADRGFGQVVGEYGFVTAFEKAHAIISGFSTSI